MQGQGEVSYGEMLYCLSAQFVSVVSYRVLWLWITNEGSMIPVFVYQNMLLIAVSMIKQHVRTSRPVLYMTLKARQSRTRGSIVRRNFDMHWSLCGDTRK